MEASDTTSVVHLMPFRPDFKFTFVSSRFNVNCSVILVLILPALDIVYAMVRNWLEGLGYWETS